MTQKLKRPISILLTVMMIAGVFTALDITAHAESTVTDTLMATDLAATSTTYTDFSGVKKDSDAVYAGNSAKSSSGAIQMRASNSSGIVTTASSRYVKKIAVTWNSATISGRTLQVYGKNTAYSAASDLYNSSTRGDSLGTIVYGTSTELEINGSYKYIGLRSGSGAMYLTDINITWAVEDAAQTFDVMWDCDNGEEPEIVSYEKDAIPSYSGTPEKAPTNDTVYTFSGWMDDNNVFYSAGTALPAVTADVIYTAQYTESPRKYTVIWKNGDAVLETDNDLLYNAVPEYNGITPQKTPDAQYTYAFDGWQSSVDGQVYATSEIPNVTQDVTYTAHYSETLNKYTVTWKNEDGTTLYSEELDYNDSEAPVYDTSKGGELTKAETEDYTYVFSGWDPEPAPVTGNAEYTAVFTPKSKHETVDVLNRELTGIAAGAGYGEWSGKTSESTAVYAGQSAGGNDSIQLRSSNSNSGIVTTESGGYAQKVKVEWNSNTSNGRTLQVYGKNTAYSSAADLYNSSTQGDLLGEIVYGTSAELVINGSYEYIGLRSESGAMYLTEVEITWGNSSETPEHTVTWKNGDTVIHSEQVKENTVPFLDLDVYGTPAKNADEDYTYRFSGWTLEGGDGAVYSNDNLPKVGAEDVTYQAYFTPRSKFSQVDTLTADIFEATGSTYKNFTDVQYPSDGINSDAVYAGNTANHSGSIQMRNSNLSGIITTASGGRAAKIEVVWDSNTHAGRTLEIYGKDTPYSPVNWNSDEGHLLGSITYGTNTGIELTVPYEYIALRSHTETLYLEKIDITWDVTAPQPHTVKWMNGEDEIYSDTVAYNTSPVYDEATYGVPQKPDDTAHYSFSGWTDGTNSYTAGAALPPLKKDTTYTAVYDSTPIYTVEWVNYNGDPLDSDTFYGSDAPVQANYEGSTPTRADDSYYSYSFLGWKDSGGNRYYNISDIPALSSGETFTAVYQSSPKIKSGRIVKTNDSAVYNTGGKYYKTSPDSEVKYFDSDYAFTDTVADDGSGALTIGGETIAITKPLGEPTAAKPTISVFAHTCYVTGEGTQDDPFVFYPNYVFSADVENVHDSTTIDKSILHPGDGLKGMARVRMLDAYIRFLQYGDNADLECAHGTNGFMGVTHTQYGNRYANSEALPYTFVGSDTIYYLGELTNAYNFSENIVLDTELGNVTPYYTVTWANWNGETIRTNNVYQGLHPSYGNIAGSTPVRPDDENYTYTFSGWSDGTKVYAPGEELPAVTGDITYTATYTSSVLVTYNITWLNEDGTQLAASTCNAGKVPVYPYSTPSKESDEQYIYTFAGWTADGVKVYTPDKLPAATADATYTVVFNAEEIPPEPGSYTVTWTNWDDTLLETDHNVHHGETPHYGGETPSRPSDENYNYTFIGWYPHLQVVTFDITYKAQYAKTPLNPVDPIEDIENIFPTNDGMGYNLEGMFYLYNDEVLPFNWDGLSVFRSDGATLTLGGKTVADIGVTLFDDSYHAEFANTVFVTGTGTHSDPFVFHPNYTYYGTKNKISDGCVVALKEEYKQGTTKAKTVSYPGDRYKGNTIVKVGNPDITQQVKFIDYSDDYLDVESYYVGVGHTTYGTHYSEATAYIDNSTQTPHPFKSGNDTLYYHGEDNNNAFVFAETPPVYQRDFGDPETFNVTWKNDNGAVLATDSCYYGVVPEYTGATPEKSTDPIKFKFAGWTPEISEVTGDVEYTATYSPKKLFTGHSLSLQGDIGIYFYLDVTAAGITPEDILNGNNSIAVNYSWKTSPAPYTDLSVSNIVLDKAYCEAHPEAFDSNYSSPTGGQFKVKCNTAVAEMSCVVNAEATVKNSSDATIYTESNEYRVRDYGLHIINNPDKFGADLVNLAKAMLDYGAKAQVVFGIATGSPANAGVDYTMQTVTPAMIEQAVKAANGNNLQSDMRSNTDKFGAKYYGTSIVYLTKTTLRHIYTVTDQGKFDAAKNNTGSFVFSDRKNPYMIFDLSNIAANHLDDLQPLTIGGQTYYYSVLDYSKNILSNANSSPANRDLAAATYWYNHYANIYLG